jgi:hypothetical protein
MGCKEVGQLQLNFAYGISLIILLVFALIFIPQQNERFYDLCGMLGFLSTMFVSLYSPYLKSTIAGGVFPSLWSFAPRQLLTSTALVVWITRLGTFLVNVRFLVYCML